MNERGRGRGSGKCNFFQIWNTKINGENWIQKKESFVEHNDDDDDDDDQEDDLDHHHQTKRIISCIDISMQRFSFFFWSKEKLPFFLFCCWLGKKRSGKSLLEKKNKWTQVQKNGQEKKIIDWWRRYLCPVEEMNEFNKIFFSLWRRLVPVFFLSFSLSFSLSLILVLVHHIFMATN